MGQRECVCWADSACRCQFGTLVLYDHRPRMLELEGTIGLIKNKQLIREIKNRN